MRSELSPSSGRIPIVCVQVAIVALLTVVKQALDTGMVDADTVLTLGSFGLILHTVWTIFAWSFLGGSLFSPYILFVASVSVFNAGQVYLEALGLNPGGLLGRQFPVDLLAQTVLLVLFALSTLNLGSFIAAMRPLTRRSARPTVRTPTAVLRRVAVVLFAIAVVPSIIEAKRAVGVVSAGGYTALYQTEAGTGIGAATTVLFDFLVPSAFLLLAGSKSRRATRIAACSIIGAYVCLQGFLGFRGSAIVVLTTSLWLWHTAIAPLPKKVLISLAVAAFLMLPVIGLLRALPAGERASFSVWQRAYTQIDNPVAATIREMGGSMAASAYTISLVPTRREFEYGATYGFAISTLVPNLFWKVHPGALNSPSKWLVETVSPATAHAGGGLGFSLIAEGYLNFGFWGTAIPMLLLGWGIGRLSQRSELGNSPLTLCFIALVTIPLLIYARAEAGNAVRGVLWYGGIPYLLVKCWPRHGRQFAMRAYGRPTVGDLAK